MDGWASDFWARNMIFSLRWACSWTLWTTCFHFASPSVKGSRTDLKLELLTPAQAANAVALENAMLWFSAAGAGPALLAMLLRGRGRVRRALAGVGLAFAVANHCVYTWILGVTLVTAPNDDFLLLSVLSAVIFILLAVGDVNAALTILPAPS